MITLPRTSNNMMPTFRPSHIVTKYVGNLNGFTYSIMPLSFNLQRSHQAQGRLSRNKKEIRSCKFYPGEMVSGICEYDNKRHTGIINMLYYDPEKTEGDPKVIFAYIQDQKTNEIMPLKIDTVKKITYNNYYGRSVIKESFDFNKNIHNV